MSEKSRSSLESVATAKSSNIEENLSESKPTELDASIVARDNDNQSLSPQTIASSPAQEDRTESISTKSEVPSHSLESPNESKSAELDTPPSQDGNKESIYTEPDALPQDNSFECTSNPEVQPPYEDPVHKASIMQTSTSEAPSIETASSITSRSTTISSCVFLIKAYEKISSHKSSRKYAKLREATESALELAHAPVFTKDIACRPENIHRVLQPLLLATETSSKTLAITALDCLGKLISYEYLSDVDEIRSSCIPDESVDTFNKPKQAQTPLEKAVFAICNVFDGESTDERVQTQVIKGLLSAVSAASTPLHQEALLNSIRTLYNIFLLSRDPSNQTIAQGTLIQMTHSVFERIKDKRVNNGDKSRRESINNSENSPTSNNVIKVDRPRDSENLDDSSSSGSVSEDSEDEIAVKCSKPVDGLNVGIDVMENTVEALEHSASRSHPPENICDSKSDLNVLDAYLLFRALCKLSIKPYQSDGNSDVKSLSMRSKLLSLYLILNILHSHSHVLTASSVIFVSDSEKSKSARTREITFLVAVKPYLCLSLSRNLVSSIPKVYEMALAIFEKVMIGMRQLMKKEIEVFFKEIILPLLEVKATSNQQKCILLTMLLLPICQDQQALVEVYLNYDCDRGSLDNNVFERMINAFSKIAVACRPNSEEELESKDPNSPKPPSSSKSNTSTITSLPIVNSQELVSTPSLSSDKITGSFLTHSFFNDSQFTESMLRLKSLECLVGVLKSLVQWSDKGFSVVEGNVPQINGESGSNSGISEEQSQDIALNGSIDAASSLAESSPTPHSNMADDPNQFEQFKQRKQALQRGVDLFNRKPKQGVERLIFDGFIKDNSPVAIARFLLESDDLDKTMIGEYLGEAAPENVAIMHAFVDIMHFTKLDFVTAIRQFLAEFRLPGEAQKIDRFMLKYAERFVEGNPGIFANADTAYVLGYSVIMLNTDLHNPQVKRRMTKEEFLKNNRGINDNNDLPDEYLESIYDEIAKNEIKLKDDMSVSNANNTAATASSGTLTAASAFDLLGNRQRKERLLAKSQEMATKTEKYLKQMLSQKGKRGGVSGMAIFYSASHFEHVRPMFELSWMACLAAISGPIQESNNPKVIRLCLDGFRSAIHIAGLFDLELARNAFVTTLANFCFLSNITEMKPKNIEAIKIILNLAVIDGNNLKSSWHDVLQVVNHLVRLQLVPHFPNSVHENERNMESGSRRTSFSPSHHSYPSHASNSNPSINRQNHVKRFSQFAMAESNSQDMLKAVDKVFATSIKLTGTAIIDFVRALCDISWGEIITAPEDSQNQKSQSRMFSLQKVVEIAHYNMNRIRMEWPGIWSVLGPHFNQVGCHKNSTISSFALDSLRQLSMKFLEMEELSHFQFQKEFLKPFVHILTNNQDMAIKDMVLRCLQQMIKTHSQNIKSGWKTMLEAFGRAAEDGSDNFGCYLQCLAQFAKYPQFQKISLQALDLYKVASNKMIEVASRNENTANTFICRDSIRGKAYFEDFPNLSFWMPIFNNLLEMIIQGLDLEVRNRSMDLLFQHLTKYGEHFPDKFWQSLLTEVLFPIFGELVQVETRMNLKIPSTVDQSIWISTTLVQAMRRFVDLFTLYFNRLSPHSDGFLKLLSACLCEADPIISQMGASCFQLYIEKNVQHFQSDSWHKVLAIMIQLFEACHRSGSETKMRYMGTLDLYQEDTSDTTIIKFSFKEAVKTDSHKQTLLQTLVTLIEEVFCNNTATFTSIEPKFGFQIMECVQNAYSEAQTKNDEFDLKDAVSSNAIKELEAFANKPLNLELSTLSSLIKLLLHMYNSAIVEYQQRNQDIIDRLITLCRSSFRQFNSISQYPLGEGVRRIHDAWRNTVVSIGKILCTIEGVKFQAVYGAISQDILLTLKHRHLSHDVQMMLFSLMSRVDEIYVQVSQN